jgi:hypothetical protein
MLVNRQVQVLLVKGGQVEKATKAFLFAGRAVDDSNRLSVGFGKAFVIRLLEILHRRCSLGYRAWKLLMFPISFMKDSMESMTAIDKTSGGYQSTKHFGGSVSKSKTS